MSEYTKNCIFCKEKIQMSDKDGKWRAYNLNNDPHDCQKNGKAKQEPKVQNDSASNHSDISLDLVLRKLKTIGVTIDLEVLRNSVNGGTNASK